MTNFTAIPKSELEVDQIDFKASRWRPTEMRGESGWEMSECFTLIGGKWEGFVSIRKPKTLRSRATLLASQTME